jgi:hypothetical protein
LNLNSDLRLARFHLAATGERAGITMGDFPSVLGRGIALSLNDTPEAGMESALRGSMLELLVPRRLRLQVAAGTPNPPNLDPVTHAVLADDPGDWLLAASGEAFMLDVLSVGVHGVMSKPRFTDAGPIATERLWLDQGPGIGVATLGGQVDFRLGGVSAYLEGNGQIHDNFRVIDGDPVKGESGGAGYAEITWDPGPYLKKSSLLLRLEGIVYHHWLMEGPYRGGGTQSFIGPATRYSLAPTIEEPDAPVRSNGNASGARIQGRWELDATGTQIDLGTNVIHYKGGISTSGQWNDFPPTLVVHPITSLRHPFATATTTIAFTVGVRFEHTDEAPENSDDSGWMPHGRIELKQPFAAIHELSLRSDAALHALSISEPSGNYWLVQTSLLYRLTTLGQLELMHEYRSEQGSSGNTWPSGFPAGHFGRASLVLEPTGQWQHVRLTLSAGSKSGGLTCRYGACRDTPDSRGAFSELTVRF